MFCIEINKENIVKNAKYLRNYTSGLMCAVVKADAYGHGAVEVAKLLLEIVDCFAVATIEEAITLCNYGIKKDILLLGNSMITSCLPSNVICSVSSVAELEGIFGKCSRIHIKVKTGMNRSGCGVNDVSNIIERAKKLNISVEGFFSHFYNSQNFFDVKNQFSVFINSEQIDFSSNTIFHICASNALDLPKMFHLDMIRWGIALYGFGSDNLSLCMNIYADIAWIGNVKKGEHIGYGNFVAETNMTICAVTMGYADGLRRNSKGITFRINDISCAVVGNVCMDVALVDVSNVDCRVGDRAYLIKTKKDVENICDAYNIIPYEVLTLFHGRAKKVYV